MKQELLANPTLRELQKWMQWVITDPRGVTDALSKPAPVETKYCARYTAPEPDCFCLITPEPLISQMDRLSIYAEGYFARIVESLQVDFATLARIVGDDLFLKIVADYLKVYPSRFTNIGEVGLHLPSFLAEFLGNDRAIQQANYLLELASVEWTVIESFYADDSPTLSLGQLSSLPDAQWSFACFQLSASVKIVMTTWPVDLLWRARFIDDDNDFIAVVDSLVAENLILLVHRTEALN